MQRGSPPSSPAANRHSKPSLCLSRSPFPGNGISGPEKNAQKRPADCNDAVSENEPSHRSPPIRGLSCTFGKSRVTHDCVVVVAVVCELGSGSRSPRERGTNGVLSGAVLDTVTDARVASDRVIHRPLHLSEA